VFSSDAENFGAISFTGVTGSQNTVSARITLAQLYSAFFDRIPGQDNNATFGQVPYSLDVSLRDDTSGATGTLSFTGQFDGVLDKKSILLNNTFTGLTTQSLTLGANVYTVTVGPYNSPGAPGSTTPGSIEADVTVQPQGGPPASPEPSCLVLAGLGLSSLGLGLWRRHASRRL
jgi:hypothetical protein